MKKVLCFGDSNTYGFIPASGLRYDENTRWSGILKTLAKDNFEIIEAGCNNRTCFTDSPSGIEQTGYKCLPSLLNKDLDFVILAIGINDLQTAFNPDTKDIEQGIEKIIKITRNGAPKAKIILAAPSVLTEALLSSYFSCLFDETSIQKSKLLPKIYENAAKKHGCIFTDLNQIASVSESDGLHYTPEAHKNIAHAIYEILVN